MRRPIRLKRAARGRGILGPKGKGIRFIQSQAGYFLGLGTGEDVVPPTMEGAGL